MNNVLVVGFGTIGRPLCRALLQNGWEIPFVLTTKGIFKLHGGELGEKIAELTGYRRVLRKCQAVLIVLSAADNGAIEFGYMMPALTSEKFVVTCAKRALANYPSLYPYATGKAPLLGIDATVGGNSGILAHLRHRINPKLPVEMHLVLNASMNCFMFELAEGGSSPSEAMEEVRRRGLAEPMGKEMKFAPFFAGEFADTMFKTSIVTNYCRLFGTPRMKMKDIREVRFLKERKLRQLFRERNRRYIVSFFRGSAPDEDVVGGFSHCISAEDDRISICAGFKRVDKEPYVRMKIPGAHNAALAIEGRDGQNGISYIEGVGAGPAPTVAALVQNLNHLTGIV